MSDGIERIVVSVKQVGKNSKEIIYKHLTQNSQRASLDKKLRARMEDSKDLNN
jgi:hypothetical protein